MFSRNLISVSKLYEQLFSFSFANNSIVISKYGLDICHACMENGPYFLRSANQMCFNAAMFKVANPKSNKKQKLNSDDETYLWHLRLGHINLERIYRLIKEGPLRELRVGTLPV